MTLIIVLVLILAGLLIGLVGVSAAQILKNS